VTQSSNLVSLRKIENLPGFVVNFLLCGPFNEDKKLTSCQALDKDYLVTSGTEAKAAPRAGLREGKNGPLWRSFAVRYGFIADLRNEYAGTELVSYAAAYLRCPKAQSARILLGSDDGIKLWFNGKLIWKNHVHRGLGVDNDIVDVNLKKGVNRLLLKIEQNFGGYEFCLRVTDQAGKPVKGLKAYLDHPRVKNPVNPAKQRTVSGFDYLCHKYATAKLKLAFSAKSPAQYRSWRKKFLKQYRMLLGPFPEKCPLRPEITEDVVVENFRRKRLLIDLEPGFSIPCYLTIPEGIRKGQKLPAVVVVHGHGQGKSDMLSVKPGPPETLHYRQSVAKALPPARSGYVTISPDFLAFGERLGKGAMFGEGQDPCPAEFAWAQTVGLIPTTVNIHAVRRCIDYLYQLPQVDNKRIGAIGHSHGGYLLTMSMAVETRIKVAVIGGFMHTIAAYYGRTWSCGSQVVPDLYNYGDLSDVACTFARRPVMIMSGMYDCVTPFPFTVAAFKKIKKSYELAGAADKVYQYKFPGEHEFQNDASMDWLDKWL